MSYATFVKNNGAYFIDEELAESNVPKILAVDPGIRHGWALITPDKKCIGAGFEDLTGKVKLYRDSYNWLCGLLTYPNLKLVMFEKFFYAFSKDSGKGLKNVMTPESIMVRGALKAAVETETTLQWFEEHPSKVRAALGAGFLDTDAKVRNAVVTMFRIPASYKNTEGRSVFFPPDVFDALALSWSYTDLSQVEGEQYAG